MSEMIAVWVEVVEEALIYPGHFEQLVEVEARQRLSRWVGCQSCYLPLTRLRVREER
jgi:uncharacterized cupin superfamily protein